MPALGEAALVERGDKCLETDSPMPPIGTMQLYNFTASILSRAVIMQFAESREYISNERIETVIEYVSYCSIDVKTWVSLRSCGDR